MKRVLSIIMTVTLVLSLTTFTAFAGNGNGKDNGNSHKVSKEFKDMKGHWGKEAVEKIQSRGIIVGYSDGTFQPDNAITEAELAVIINRLIDARLSADNDDDESILDDNKSDVDDEELSDVPAWAKNAISKGFEKHYLNQKRFHSHVQANRLMACVAIAKALDLEPVTDFTNNPFKDRKLMSDEDYGYLLALYKGGYISGYPDGNFNPNKLITRAQIAKIIEKLLDEGVPNDDKTAPTWSSGAAVTAEDVQAASVKLTWSGAKDDIKVVGYKIVLKVDNESKVKYVTGTTAVVGGLEPETEYDFTVEAKDAAGNWSNDGPSVTVVTDEAVGDTEDPSWSDDSSVTATAIRVDSVDLKWSGATDDVKVVSYKVTYKLNDTTATKYFTGTTGRISGLEADKAYNFTVEVKDAAGNWSDDGPAVTVTTLKKTVADTAAPTWPSGSALTISSSESGVVTIVWPDAEDNTGVTAYKLYKDGQLINTLGGDVNNVNVTGLAADTEYAFKVRAVDAAGNISTSLSKNFLTD